MPPKSQRQRRFMHAVEEGKVKGVKPSVGREYLKDDHKKGLPEKAPKKKSKR